MPSPRFLRLAALLAPFTIVLAAGGTACVHDGGCYATQSSFTVTPAESCLSFTPDVCDAADGYLTVVNNCTDDLIIAGAASGDGDAATSTQTVSAGQTANVYILPFETAAYSGGTVEVPAALGATSISITYTVTNND
jgi:hypothetical protein